MYKVFINNKCIFITSESNFYAGKNDITHVFSSETALTETIDKFDSDKNADKLYIAGNTDKIFSVFPVISAAGGLVIKDSNKILFIYRYGKWDLPKGKVELSEKPEETAVREVTEETGVTGLEITKTLIPTYHTYKLENKRVIKKTYWFEMSYKDDSHILPQTVEDITVVKWLDKKDIPWAMRDSYASIIELLRCSGYL